MMPLARRWMVERDNLAPYVGQPRIYPLFSGSHAFSCHHIAKHGNTLFHNMSFKNYQRSTSGTKDQFQSILPTKGDTCSLWEKTSITDHKRIISKIFCHSRFLGIRKDSRRFIEVILKGDCKGNPKKDQIKSVSLLLLTLENNFSPFMWMCNPDHVVTVPERQ